MDTLNGRKVLLTGANGFLGSHLIARLERDGAVIHALSRSKPEREGGANWWRGDLRDADWVSDVVNTIGPDVVFHLASASLGGQDVKFVRPTFENDLLTTVNVLSALKDSGCSRLVLVASLEEPVFDGRPLSFSSPYAAAKAAGTFYGLMFHQLYALPVAIVRPFMVYGPGQKSYKVIPYTICSMLRGEAPKLSSGDRPVDWVYVGDVMDAFVAAAIQPDAIGKPVDIGSGTMVSVRDAVTEVHSLIPGAPAPMLGAQPDRLIENVRRADTETAARMLGWKATTPLREGLALTIDWYRAQLAEQEEANSCAGAVPRA